MNWKEKKAISVIAVIVIVLIALISCGAGKRIPSPQAERATTRGRPYDKGGYYPEYAGVVEYVVKGDDTLLGIAYKMCPEDLPTEAYYRYAKDVKRLNGRETDILYWKETIKIPVCEDNPSVTCGDSSLCTREPH